MRSTKVRSINVLYPSKEDEGKLEVDQIVLQSKLYEKFFGKQYDRDQQSKPWRKGIILVSNKIDNRQTRKVRLIFRGGSMKGVNNDTCIIGFKASQQLGIECEGSTVELKSETQWIARFLFYWNHPLNHTRVSFKLGVVASMIATLQIVDRVISVLIF